MGMARVLSIVGVLLALAQAEARVPGIAAQRMTVAPAKITSIAVSPDGQIVALAAESDDVFCWDVAQAKPLGRLKGPTAGVGCLAWSPDGKTLASGSEKNRSVVLWSMPDAKPLRTITVPLRVIPGDAAVLKPIVFTPDSEKVAIFEWQAPDPNVMGIWRGPPNSRLGIWDVSSGRRVRALGEGGTVQSIAFSPDGKRAAAIAPVGNGRGDGGIGMQLFDYPSFRTAQRLGITGPEGLGVRPDAHALFAVAWADADRLLATDSETIRMFDLRGKILVEFPDADGAPVGLVAGGKWMLSYCDHSLGLHDVTTGQMLADLGVSSWIYSIAVTADGNTLWGAVGATLYRWDLTTIPKNEESDDPPRQRRRSRQR